jgi:uncharacterized protein (DUF433 family)
MQLEDYFDFDNPNGIRIKPTRVNLENVVYAAMRGETPSQIVRGFPSLTLEKVHATLAYYYRNQQQVDAYMRDQEAAYDEAKRQHEQGERPEIVQRLLKLRAEQEGRKLRNGETTTGIFRNPTLT